MLLWARLAGSLAVSWLKSNGWIFVRICSKRTFFLGVLSNVWRRCLRQYEPQEFLLENFVCCYYALAQTHSVALSIRLPTNLFAVLDITLNVPHSIQLYESRILNCLRFYANSFFFLLFFHSFVAKTLGNNGQKSDLDFYHHMCVFVTVNWILFFFFILGQMSKFRFYEWLNCCKKRDTHALDVCSEYAKCTKATTIFGLCSSFS